MTEQLKTLMDRAADRDFAAVDLDAITGEPTARRPGLVRRRCRRRSGTDARRTRVRHE